MNRAAGILMPITSLPGEYGIGCFSKERLSNQYTLDRWHQLALAYYRPAAE